MNPIPNALSHYWNLRAQGIAPGQARDHVRSRFGVIIDPEQPLASTAAVVSEDPVLTPIIEPIGLGFGQDFCKTVVTVASNPQGLMGTA